MAKTNPNDILVATESFSGELDDGTPISARAGETRFRASHPAAKKWAQYMKPVDVHYDVEQATAAPGENR